MKLCEYCLTEFTPTHGSQVYCTPNCRREMDRANCNLSQYIDPPPRTRRPHLPILLRCVPDASQARGYLPGSWAPSCRGGGRDMADVIQRRLGSAGETWTGIRREEAAA